MRMTKRLYGILSAICLLALIGTMGGMELDQIGIGDGCALSMAALAGWVWFAYIAGAFREEEATDEDVKTEV